MKKIFKKLTRIGLGSSFIINPVYINYFNKKINMEETNKISFWYFSFFNDWILYKNNKWECFVTEQIGYGKPSFVKEVNDDVVSDVNVDLYVNEISGQVNYKFSSWIGIGTGFGYRNLFNKKSFIGKVVTAKLGDDKKIWFAVNEENSNQLFEIKKNFSWDMMKPKDPSLRWVRSDVVVVNMNKKK